MALLCLLSAAAWAAGGEAGEVVYVYGNVTAVGAGDIRELRKGDRVFEGETIATGSGARARIKFTDGSFVYVRSASRFKIQEYRNSGSAEEDRSVFSLLKGGFRAITGMIGKRNRENVKINTPVATIGIRGTDHQARYCRGDCLDLMKKGVAPPSDGLYNGTSTGATTIGGKTFKAGSYGYTNLKGNTVALRRPPKILSVDNMPNPTLPDEEEGAGEDSGALETEGGVAEGDAGGNDGDAGDAGDVGGGAGGSGEEGAGAEGGEEFEIPPERPGAVATDCVQ